MTEAQAASKPQTVEVPNCALFVGRISAAVTEKEFFDYFSEFPNTLGSTGLLSAKINVDPDTKISKCSGFLNYRTVEEAALVMEKFQQPTLKGQLMVLNYYRATAETRVFLYKIPNIPHEDIIETLTREIGPISYSYFPKNVKVATIAFESVEDKEKALLLGCIHMYGHDIPMTEYKNQKKRTALKNDLITLKESRKQHYRTNKNADIQPLIMSINLQDYIAAKSITVSQFPSNWTSNELMLVFNKYGAIKQIGVDKSFAVVEFETTNAATMAADGMHNRVYNPWNSQKPVMDAEESETVLRRFRERRIESKPMCLSVGLLSSYRGFNTDNRRSYNIKN